MAERGGTSRAADSASTADDASGHLCVTDGSAIAEVVALYRDHSRWAVWRPAEGRGWVALRPASSRPPGPEVPMIWAYANTAVELAARMRQADASLSAG